MRVLIFINNLGVGGAERLVIDDINEMINRNIDVFLVTLKPEKINSLAEQCRISKNNWYLINFGSLLNPVSWIKVFGILLNLKPEVVITHLWYSNTIGRITSLFCGVKKVIAFEHNVYDSLKTRKMFLIDWLLQFCTDQIIAVSDSVKRSLLKHRIKNNKILVLLNCIDLSKYTNLIMESLDGKKKNKFTFIFIGRLIKQKGVDILLRAFAQLKESELLIVGSGLEEDDYKSLAKELKIENNVKFLGIRKDIPDLLAYADCFVLPSRYEGLPMVLLEAVASKKVIILSDFESAREIIKDNENGFVVQREDWQGLAKVMDLVKNDPEVFGKIKSGVASDSLKFSIKTHVDFLVGLF